MADIHDIHETTRSIIHTLGRIEGRLLERAERPVGRVSAEAHALVAAEAKRLRSAVKRLERERDDALARVKAWETRLVQSGQRWSPLHLAFLHPKDIPDADGVDA